MVSIRHLTIPQVLAALLIVGFFGVLAGFAVLDVYRQHVFDHGAIVVFYQLMRLLSVFYIFWLQYVLGAGALYIMAGRVFPLVGMAHVIASFLLGTAMWHVVLFAIGLIGGLFYPVMFLLAGGVMLASYPHLVVVVQRGRQACQQWHHRVWDEKCLLLMVLGAALLFLFLKGTYPSGGHDFYNHYFPYYKEVLASGSLGPHAGWYQYFYSKGLGMYFMAMILLDPLAIHLVGASFILLAACIVYDALHDRQRPLLVPLWGVFLFFMLYTYTPGRGLFALNGGWGDLEKTHELSAVLLLGIVWLVRQALATRSFYYGVTLCAVSVALVIIFLGSAALAGVFYLLLLAYCLFMRDRWGARLAFITGGVMGVMLLLILLVNYLATGVITDQLILPSWSYIDWRRVVEGGYTLELYSHLNDHYAYAQNNIPVLDALPYIFIEFFRLYMLWPLLLVGIVALLLCHRQRSLIGGRMRLWLLFLLASLIFVLFFGGRSQPISFFRFSSFNYAPMLIVCLLPCLWLSARMMRVVIISLLVLAVPYIGLTQPHVVRSWQALLHTGSSFNTGRYSVYEALADQSGRAGRMAWGGVYPAMAKIYANLPAGTRVWSFHNRSYCMLASCHVQQYFSQVTSPRWYDIALGSVDTGKQIMMEEGLNLFFYSRAVPKNNSADTKDQLAGFYKGFAPEHIADTFGVLWTNGWDYLLTWKENSIVPLDEEFLASWQQYYDEGARPRREILQVEELAAMVKKAVEDPSVTTPPTPAWYAQPE